MDARDYMRIMHSENLPETKLVKESIEQAKKCQRIIKKMEKEVSEGETFWTDQDELIRTYLSRKTEWIKHAIEMARWAKEFPDLNRFYELKTKR